MCLAVSRDWLGFENIGDLDLDEEESLQEIVKLQLKDTIEGYLQSINIATEGGDIVKELKHILECFGYGMTIRRSSYVYEKSDDSSGRKQLQRVGFVCPFGKDHVLKETCGFKLSVFTTSTEFFEGTGEGLHGVDYRDKYYSARYPDGCHAHPPSTDTMERILPASILKEAINMKHKSLVATEDIVRHLEDNTDF